MGDFFCSLSLSRRLPASPPLRLVCESLDSIALERVILICCSCVCVSKSESVICCLVFLSSFFSLPRFSSDGKRRLESCSSRVSDSLIAEAQTCTHRHTLLISRCVFPFCAAANEGPARERETRAAARHMILVISPETSCLSPSSSLSLSLLMSSRVNVNQPILSPSLVHRKIRYSALSLFLSGITRCAPCVLSLLCPSFQDQITGRQ